MFASFFLQVLNNKRPKMDHTKIVPADLDSPRLELSVRGLVFVVAFAIFLAIDLCVCVLAEQSSCK